MTSLPIQIPDDYELLVTKGDNVKIGMVLAKQKQTPSELIIHLSKRLKISPKSIEKYLRKYPGDQILKGETLAHKDGLFGDTVVVSNLTGTISNVDTHEGTVTIKLHFVEPEDDDSEILCPLDGSVLLCHNDEIVLQTDKNVYLGEKGTGSSARGLLKIIDSKDQKPITSEAITVEAIDAILFGPSFEQEAIAKASAIGVGGILTLSLSDTEIAYINEKRLSLPVIEVSPDTGKGIAKWKRKEMYIDGKTGAILLLSYEKSTR